MSPRHRVLLGVAAVAAVVSTVASGDEAAYSTTPPTSASSEVSGAGSTAGATVPTLAWRDCPPAPSGSAPTDGFECATASVPMDYAAPHGDTFELAVIKRSADDEAAFFATGPQAVPRTDDELAAFVRFRDRFNQKCVDHATTC